MAGLSCAASGVGMRVHSAGCRSSGDLSFSCHSQGGPPRVSCCRRLSGRGASTRLHAFATSSASTSSSEPSPDMWATLRVAASFAMDEADAFRKSFSGQLHGAVETSVEGLNNLYKGSLNSVKGLDLQQKAHEVAESVSGKAEEVAFEASREALRLDAKHGLAERAREAWGKLLLVAAALDCRLQIRQKLRLLQWELVYHSLILLRLYQRFQRTPVFPFCAGFFLVWMFRSGIVQHVLYWMLWVVPLLPVAARLLARAALIEGNCPCCGHHFMGPRKLKLSCRQCNEVVWQPKGGKGAAGSASASSDESVPPPLVVVDLHPDGSYS